MYFSSTDKLQLDCGVCVYFDGRFGHRVLGIGNEMRQRNSLKTQSEKKVQKVKVSVFLYA